MGKQVPGMFLDQRELIGQRARVRLVVVAFSESEN